MPLWGTGWVWRRWCRTLGSASRWPRTIRTRICSLVSVFCYGDTRLCRPQCPRGRTPASPYRWQKCGWSPCRRRLPLLRTAGPVSLHPFARRLTLVRPVSKRSVVVAEVGVSRSLSRSFSWFRPVTPSRFGSPPRTKLALRRAHFRLQLRYLVAQGVDDGKPGFACCLGLCRLLDNGRQTRCVPVVLWEILVYLVSYPQHPSHVVAVDSSQKAPDPRW